MSKNVIFFVHGVGRHADGWSRAEGGPIHALIKASKQYDCFNGLNLEDLVDMVEIRYDDIFDQHLDQWDDLASEFKTTAAASTWFNKVTDLLSSVGNDGNQFAQFGGDVILYYAFELIARRVRLRVNSIISQAITSRLESARSQLGSLPEFSIVGHSLGTTIVHDSLHQLASNNWLPRDGVDIKDVNLTVVEEANVNDLLQNPVNPYSPGNFMWNSVYMVSNTSRLLHRTSLNPYNSLLQPGETTRFFYNIEHELDPISKLKQFKIPHHWNRRRAFYIEVDHIHEVNIHGYAHYLKRPSVHRPLFRNMIDEFDNNCNDQAQALELDFPKFSGEFAISSKRTALKNKLEKLKSEFASNSIAKFQQLIAQYSSKVGKLS